MQDSAMQYNAIQQNAIRQNAMEGPKTELCGTASMDFCHDLNDLLTLNRRFHFKDSL